MALHIFQSIGMPELYGFTADATGANLPGEAGPWAAAGNAIPLGTTMASTSPEIDQEIEKAGFALVKGRTNSEPLVRISDSEP
jgi:hypothetical protein